jgi:MoaA/NifB/PqqE/SkfB family radical SAM enzyme
MAKIVLAAYNFQVATRMETNMYLNLNRVEYVVTNNCTGRCKHCSVGEDLENNSHLEYDKMKGVLTQICKRFEIKSIMCFGGEPLLYHQEVAKIMNEATICDVTSRQIITNGYFNKSNSVIEDVAATMKEVGVTDILLSVDAFHQESIPLEPVYEFVRQVKKDNVINMKLHPAWLIDKDNDNVWNDKTKQILKRFDELEIPISQGNNIFLSGNAVKYLAEYYPKQAVDLAFRCGQAKYTDRLDDVDTLSITPNGDVCVCCFTIGNVYEEDINTIIDRYDPNKIPAMKILLNSGVKGLIDYAQAEGVTIDIGKHYSACGVCREIVRKITY